MDYYFCFNAMTDNRSLVRDGQLSFPSGHSSLSFACMMFCVLYMMSKFKLYSSPSPSTTMKSISHYGANASLWKLLLCLSPLALASFIAISRTLDYHHNFSDILGGCVLGLFIAPCCYFLNYPSLFSWNCDLPLNRYYVNLHSTRSIDGGNLYDEEYGMKNTNKTTTITSTTRHYDDENNTLVLSNNNEGTSSNLHTPTTTTTYKRSLSVQDNDQV